MAKKITNLYTAMLSGMMAVLGFASCADDGDCPDDRRGIMMYGTPSATYKAEGTVTDKSTGKAVQGIRVVMAKEYHVAEGERMLHGLDTVYTDRNGKFVLSGQDYDNRKLIFFKDVDGAENGEYKGLEMELIYESSEFGKKDPCNSWSRGEATKKMGNVAMTPGRDETEE